MKKGTVEIRKENNKHLTITSTHCLQNYNIPKWNLVLNVFMLKMKSINCYSIEKSWPKKILFVLEIVMKSYRFQNITQRANDLIVVFVFK